VDYLHNAGIAFADAAGSNAEPVVEYVLAVLLLHAHDLGKSLHDLTVGVVGCGHVGSRLASRLDALGVRHLLNDPPLAERVGPQGFVPLSIALQADVVSLHVPLTTGGPHPTLGLLDTGAYARMKPGALLINTSRGQVMNESALLNAMIAGADLRLAIDVWDQEPSINAALAARTWIATPHIAGYSLDAKLRGTQAVYEACCRLLDEEPVWDYRAHLPAPRQHAPGTSTKGEDTLRAAVLAVYDPRDDDRQLRASLASVDPGVAFDSLRKHYPPRREFDSLVLPAYAETGLRLRMEALGFNLV
jgi:erythronate-4-phosphate dehydrogenase